MGYIFENESMTSRGDEIFLLRGFLRSLQEKNMVRSAAGEISLYIFQYSNRLRHS